MMHLNSRKGFVAAIALLWAIAVWLAPGVGGFQAAIADEASDSDTVPEVTIPATVDSSSISSEKVSQFADAYLGIVKLIDRRSDDLQSAETTEQYQRLERELEAEAVKIIGEAGLTPPEYLQMLTLADTDAEFGERIATQLREMQE